MSDNEAPPGPAKRQRRDAVPRPAITVLGTGVAHPATAVRPGDLEARLLSFSADKAGMDYETFVQTHLGAETMYEDREGLGIVHYLGEAARQAIAHAGMQPADIDSVVVATASGRDPVAGIRGDVLAALDLHERHCIELVTACTGFLEALLVASDRAAVSGEVVLVTAGDLARTIYTDPQDFVNVGLMGDAAAAAVLGPGEPGFGFREGESTTKADWRRDAVRNDDGYFVMNAKALRTRIPEAFAEQFRRGCERNAFDPATTVAIPHQTNGHLLDVLRRELGLPPEHFVNVFHKYGNCANGSIGLALHHAFRDGLLRRGTNAVLFGAGGGFNVGHLGFTADRELPEREPFRVLFVDEDRAAADALADAMCVAARADPDFRMLFRLAAAVESSREDALARLRDDATVRMIVIDAPVGGLSGSQMAEALHRRAHNVGCVLFAADDEDRAALLPSAGFVRVLPRRGDPARLWAALRDGAQALRNRDVNLP